MRLAGRSALVTGGGQGIGQAICQRLAEEGAAVAVVDINLDAAAAVAGVLRKTGTAAIALQADVANHVQARAIVSQAIAELNQLDILVNNAAIGRHQFLDDMPEADWDEVMGVNAKACFNYCQAALPHMKARHKGAIVNIVSRAVLGNPRETNYSASKAAVVGFSRALALEAAPHGIRVNCVAPSTVDTPWTRAYSDEWRRQTIKLIPMGRLAEPSEIASAVLFLSSDEASYITGQTLHVCGGRSIGISTW